MGFQIRRVIGQQRISRRVRLIESVTGKLRHQIKYLLNLFLREAALDRALRKALTLLRHFFSFLLAHCAPQQVSFTQRISRQAVGDLHHLFLIHNHAKRFLQNLL